MKRSLIWADKLALAAFVLTATVALVGCNAARRAEVTAQIKTSRDACNSETFATHVEKARCLNNADEAAQGLFPPDLISLRAAARIALAEKVDKKQMTEAEADLEFAKINSQANNEASDRFNQNLRNRAQMIGAINATRPRSCVTIGNSVTCY